MTPPCVPPRCPFLTALPLVAACRSGALYVLSGASGQVAHRSMQFAVQQDSGRQSRANFPVHGLTVCPTDSSVFALSGQHGLVVCRAHWMKAAALHPLARLSFGAADATGPPAAAAGGEEEAPGQQRAAVVAQVTFSRAHPEHLYCTDPSAPGQLLLLDFASQATIKTLFAPLAAGAAITALALDPKESLLAAGTSGGTVLLLRLATEAWSELTAHSSAVTGLAFTAGGIRLISAAGTATFVWDVEQ